MLLVTTAILWVLAFIESYIIGRPIWDQLKIFINKEWIYITGQIGVFLFCAIAFTLFDLIVAIAVIILFVV
jgi:hypothetical protein